MTHLFRVRFWLIFSVFLFQEFFITAEENTIPSVLVSVAPHKFFVEQIANEKVHVNLMVPEGASSHTYEPTPRQMIAAGQAAIWFQIGESFEIRATQALKSHHPAMEFVDMRKGIDLIHERGCHCCPGGEDLHFWLSARQGEIQARTIADALKKHYPEHADMFQRNLEHFVQELKDLDQKIANILKPLKERNILVSHPAYAYFCRDYDLTQYSIEIEGKDPTPQAMTTLLNKMKQLQINTIFIQVQYNNKAAQLVADILKAKLVVLNPYSERYCTSMLEIAHAFASQ